MGIIFDFFGEEIAGIDETRYVLNFDDPPLMCFANTVFMEVDVFCAFEGDRGGPVDCRFVIVVDRDALRGIGEAEVLSAVFDREEIVDAFVCSINFSHTETVCCFILSDGFPSNGPPCATDKITR